MGKNKQLGGLLIACAIALGVLAIFYGDVMIKPSSYFLGVESGDALKNYYTPYYYVNHDDGGWWFDGMYYPYGEHIVYSDNQPIISVSLKFIHENVFPLGPSVVGILNWLIFLGQILCAGMVFLLLLKFRVPFWYAVLLGVIISFLSPQINRFSGHYALSYSFFIPLIWLLSIHAFQSLKWKWFVLLGLVFFIFAFIHAYYLAIGLLFLAGYLLYFAISKKLSREWWLRYFLPAVTITFAVLASMIILIKATDRVNDRPNNPTGHMLYRATPRSVFLPSKGPVLEGMNKVMPLPQTGSEGFAYVGLVPILAVLFWGAIYFAVKRSEESRIDYSKLPVHLKAGLTGGVIGLIYSFAILYWWGIPNFLEFLGPLHQFRSTGRFAWVFFYPFSILGAIALFRVFQYFLERKARVIAHSLFAILVVFWFFEAFVNINLEHFKKSGPMAGEWPTEASQSLENILQQKGYKSDDFQALIGFPFFVYGSERIRILQEHIISVVLLRISANTGLPMVNGMLSRTSFNVSKKLTQLTGNQLLPKPALTDFPDDRPFLLVVADYKLKPNEKQIIARAEKLGEWQGRGIYKLPLKVLEQKKMEMDKFIDDANAGNAIFYSFDTVSSNRVMTGSGARNLKKGELLYSNRPPILSDSLEFSTWMYADSSTYLWPAFNVKLLDTAGNQIAWKQFDSRESIDIWGHWFRLNVTLKNPEKPYRAMVWIEGRASTIDNFLIRNPRDTRVIFDENGPCLLNNYPLEDPQ